MIRPSAWHTLGRALGMVAALPARAVGLAIAVGVFLLVLTLTPKDES